jgi:hypothetical protein
LTAIAQSDPLLLAAGEQNAERSAKSSSWTRRKVS